MTDSQTKKCAQIDDHDRAFWTLRGVARVMGINFSEAMVTGRLGRAGYSDMIDTCIRSQCMPRCSHWLGQCSGCATSPPPDCANAARLEKLRQRLC